MSRRLNFKIKKKKDGIFYIKKINKWIVRIKEGKYIRTIGSYESKLNALEIYNSYTTTPSTI
jgi:hypothetical protein